MDFNNLISLKQSGLSGFKTVKELWQDKSCLPKVPGVYLVLNPTKRYEFISPGVGGFFKGRNPNVPIQELRYNEVPNSLVVYVDKAGGTPGKATLRSRLGQYLRFGQGKPVGHWGGRHIWQLKNHQSLIFCWKPTPEEMPRAIEQRLIREYQTQFLKRPFANLQD